MSQFLIIGASSGIGRQLTLQLANNGHIVYASYHTHPQSSTTQLRYFPCDVLTEKITLPEITTLDGLVYCPGSIQLKPFARISPEDFVNDYQLQVAGAVRVLQAAYSLLKKSEQAAVVLFSTVAVKIGLPFHAQVAASKGAVEGLTKALAAEWAPSVRVNAIAPSLTETPLAASLISTPEKIAANAQRHPLKRIGTVNDIADMAMFLLSPQSSWISGQIFHVDGGMSSLRV